MKRRYWLIVGFMALLVSGCSDPEGEQRTVMKRLYNCEKDTTNQRAEFILKCVEGANPKSDEEPEDWLRECQYMAEETICEQRTMEIVEKCEAGDSLFGKCYLWDEISRKPLGD